MLERCSYANGEDVLCFGLCGIAFLSQVLSHFRLVIIQQIRVGHDDHGDIEPPSI